MSNAGPELKDLERERRENLVWKMTSTKQENNYLSL